MQAIRSLLVVIGADGSESLALKKAKMIAGVTQSHLHLLICDTRTDHSRFLDSVTASLKNDGFSVTAQQAWFDSPHQTVIKVQQAEGCALIVKQHKADNPLKKALLTPEDWKLLRFSPVPVLMVRNDTPWANSNILAAVDVGNADEEHRSLHSGIIAHAYDIAQMAKANLHVVTAYPSPMLSAADPTFQLKETIEERYREQCKAFQDEYDISEDRLHVVEGPADVVISQVARKLAATVTVIGTVARTGISGALIGNTAEVILDSLDSDMLVLKPDDVMEHLETLLKK